MSATDPLLAPMTGTDHREVAGVHLDIVKAGIGRVKRVVYPAGFRWDTHMKPITGTDHCMHTHVGFIARGRVQVRYQDGCLADFAAPAAFVIEAGHEGWVVGDQPAVMIEFDFEGETDSRFGLPGRHTHG
jgi:hypothetical protein